MTRIECENRLLALAAQAAEVYKAYNPGGEGLSLTCFGGQLDVTGFGGDVAATRFENGEVWRWKGGWGDV